MKLKDEVTLARMTSLFCSPLSKIHDLPVMMESNHFSASLEIILSGISQILINGLCRKSSALGKCMKLLWWCLLGCWPKVMAGDQPHAFRTDVTSRAGPESTHCELREPERPVNKSDFLYQSLKRFQNSGENVQDENHIGGQLLR